MVEKIDALITVYGRIDSSSLYDEVLAYHMNVMDLGPKTLVYSYGESPVDEVKAALDVCNKYGECELTIFSI